MKKRILIFALLLTFLITTASYADTNTDKDDIKSKLEEQNNLIYEILKKSKKTYNSNDRAKELLNQFNNSIKNTDGTSVDVEDIKNRMKEGAFYTSIIARKYIIPIYIIIFFICIYGMTFYNTKNPKKKKKFILILLESTVFTLILVNLPLIILYFQYNKVSDVTTEDNLFNGLFSFIYFMKTNSYPVAIIMYFYGIINSILGRKDVARYELSRYLKKGAIIILLTFNLLPIVIQYLL